MSSSSSMPLTGRFFASSSVGQMGQMGGDRGERVCSGKMPASSESENDLSSDLDVESTRSAAAGPLPAVKRSREEQDAFASSKSLGPRQDDSADDLEMFAFLEKYSDRLVDMVSDKVMEKTMAKERSLRSPLDSR